MHVNLHINGQPVAVPAGCSVAAALAIAGSGISRTSVNGEARAPLCGMGICQECRVSINGVRGLACQTTCSADMRVEFT
ncbi:(2Fe-2S)-binding protein [Rhodoferax sp.]|uniref:(2Fe-2S)-binding protein n=1 Tax=Rhodoferax sp. TaxID=50421 RepID=UPI0025EF2E04|nr:(2Fe-2S)-binding protein [Rhodoferax sp.]